MLSPFRLAAQLFQGAQDLGREAVADAGAEGSFGVAGDGGQLVQEIRELARGGAGGVARERRPLQGEVACAYRNGAVEGPQEAFYLVVCRFAEGAVDHADGAAGPELGPGRFGSAGGVEDEDDLAPDPAGGLEGVVCEQLARIVEAAGRACRVAPQGTDEVVAVQDQVRLHARCRRASNAKTAAATETFNDSTAPRMGTVTDPSHTSRTSRLMPRPSLPKTKEIGPARSSFVYGVASSLPAAYTHRPASFMASTARRRFVSRATRTCSLAPALALTATAVTPTERSLGITTPLAPAPSATRKIAPRFLGSVTPSSTRTSGSGLVRISASPEYGYGPTRATTP